MPEIIETAYPEIRVVRKQPENFNPADEKLFEHEFLRTFASSGVRTLKKALVVNRSVFCDGRYYDEQTKGAVKPGLIKRVYRTVLKLLWMKVRIPYAVWIADPWSDGFFHWMCDALPRLFLVPAEHKDTPVLLPEKFRKIGFINQCLSLLKKEIVFTGDRKVLAVENLLLPDYAAPTGNYRPEIMKKIREVFINKAGVEPTGAKIYISRARAPKRRIRNEIEVCAVFVRCGFEVHYFEDYSFSEQIRLAGGADVVAGLHGAGLTHMMFMRPGAKVLEFRNRGDAVNNCYFALASALELKYYYQLCDTGGAETLQADFFVDPAELEKNLELMNHS